MSDEEAGKGAEEGIPRVRRLSEAPAAKERAAAFMTPREQLEEAIRAIDEGKMNPSKLLILALDDAAGEFRVIFFNAGMKSSECVAVCEAGKMIFLRDMNYT